MPRPLVSVHVVTYNQRDFIGDAIESALAQDYPNLEVVVSDDASTDGTDDTVREYARRYPTRVVAVTGETNLGISGNSNRCLRRCSGEYVAFLAGDDLMLPGKITAQIGWFEADPARVLCAHDMEHFESRTGRRLSLHSAISRPRAGRGVAAFLRAGCFAATSSVMVRAAAIPSRGFDERIRVHSDWKFAADCLVQGGEFGHLPDVFGRYRRHETNATARFSGLLWDEIHLGLALLEAERPELVSACKTARAYAYYQRAVALLQQGHANDARHAIRNAWRYDPLVSWKLPAWWTLTLLPPKLTSRFIGQRPT
jgi:glycosyltransferase involved in cell wall biosynthesis